MKLVGFPLETLQHFETLVAYLLSEVRQMHPRQFEVVRDEVASVDVGVLLTLPPLKMVVPSHAPTKSRSPRLDELKRGDAN